MTRWQKKKPGEPRNALHVPWGFRTVHSGGALRSILRTAALASPRMRASSVGVAISAFSAGRASIAAGPIFPKARAAAARTLEDQLILFLAETGASSGFPASRAT